MLFKHKYHPLIVAGEVTVTFRNWSRPQAKAGGRYRLGKDILIEVDRVDRVRVGEISEADARRSSFGDREALIAFLRKCAGQLTDASEVFRVEFHYAGVYRDPIADLADEPSAEELAELAARLAKMDRLSRHGPWTTQTLELIAEHPRVAAPRLAPQVGREVRPFKADVRKLKKLGMRSSDTAEFFFDDVRAPQRYRIGDEGAGFMYQMLQFQEERVWGALSSLVSMDATIDATIDYARDRQAFGKSILDNQVVHFRMAELKTEVQALRSLSWDAVDKMMGGEDVTMLASMAKLKAGRLLRELNDSCLQYWGGMGYMEETPVSRAYRDGRLASIGGGADEVMLSIICKYMGVLPGKTNR